MHEVRLNSAKSFVEEDGTKLPRKVGFVFVHRQLYILDEGIPSYTAYKELIFLYVLGDVKCKEFKAKTHFVFALYRRSLYLSCCKVKCTPCTSTEALYMPYDP
jgi:hypothetical protein